MAEIASDYGRTTRIVASGYDRLRVHQGRLVRGEQRVLVLDLAGALPPARKIVTARWQCDNGTVLGMSNPRISDNQQQTSIDLRAAWMGCSTIKCTATLDNGEAFAQLAVFDVADGWWFTDGQSQQGPTDLSVTV